MRLLLISHFFPPESRAGTENYTFGIAKALQARGHDVLVLCASDWIRGAAYWNGVSADIVEDIPVRRANINWQQAHNPNRALYTSPQATAWVTDILADYQPDMVHITSAYALGVGILDAVYQAGIPLAVTLTDFWFLCPRTILLRGDGTLCDGRTTPWQCQQCLLADSGVYKQTKPFLPDTVRRKLWQTISAHPFLARQPGARGLALDMDERKALTARAMQLPDRILSPSRFVQQMVAQAGLSDRVAYLPHGHELSWLQAYKGKTASTALRFGFMGQVQHQKGVHILVDAYCEADLGDRARLDIWGDLEQSPAYVRQVRRLSSGNDSVRLRGRFPRADIAQVLADIDVMVVPSVWYENAPLVIHEAFATHTPVIATNLGGMAELVQHERNGLLFELNDSADLARQLRRMVDEPALHHKLGEGAPTVKTTDEEVDELEAIYGAILAERAVVRLQV